MRRRLRWILAFAGSIAIACHRESAGEPALPARLANLLVVTLDTTRADHLSLQGYARETSPQVAKLAAEGVWFDESYAAASSTLPSHVSLFTGAAPITHGVLKNGMRLGDGVVTLAERMHAAGAQTAAIVSSFVLDHRFGLDRGFDHYEDDCPREGSSYPVDEWRGFETGGAFDRRANLTTDRAIRWLDGRDATRPFFLWVHYFDPHDPYVPPEPWKSRFAHGPNTSLVDALLERATIDAYDGEIAFTDDEVGRLLAHLAALGLVGDTLVVLTADHGEGLGQHGVVGHAINIYEEAVRVPLVVRWPGRIAAGRRIDEPVESVDVLPTLLELLGLPHDGVGRGRSLAGALLRGDALDANHPVFTHRRPYDKSFDQQGLSAQGELFGVRRGRYKWIEGTADGTRELFDLATDPRESMNLASREPERAEALSKEVRAFRSANTRTKPLDRSVSPEDRERLRALGYTN